METVNTTATMEFIEVKNHPPCPNCRNAMAPVDRVYENGTSFVWYRCRDAHCGGQWLEKRPFQQQRKEA